MLVTCHLAAHDEHVARRNADYERIASNLFRTGQIISNPGTQPDKSASSAKNSAGGSRAGSKSRRDMTPPPKNNPWVGDSSRSRGRTPPSSQKHRSHSRLQKGRSSGGLGSSGSSAEPSRRESRCDGEGGLTQGGVNGMGAQGGEGGHGVHGGRHHHALVLQQQQQQVVQEAGEELLAVQEEHEQLRHSAQRGRARPTHVHSASTGSASQQPQLLRTTTTSAAQNHSHHAHLLHSHSHHHPPQLHFHDVHQHLQHLHHHPYHHHRSSLQHPPEYHLLGGEAVSSHPLPNAVESADDDEGDAEEEGEEPQSSLDQVRTHKLMWLCVCVPACLFTHVSSSSVQSVYIYGGAC